MCASVTTILFDMKNIFAKISPYNEIDDINLLIFFNTLATDLETMYQHIASFMLKSSSDKLAANFHSEKYTQHS